MKKVLGKVSLLTLVLAGGLLAKEVVAADAAYTVQNGDSFYLIGQKHGVDPYALAAANGLGIYDLILPGQVLTIPGYQAPAVLQLLCKNRQLRLLPIPFKQEIPSPPLLRCMEWTSINWLPIMASVCLIPSYLVRPCK